MEVTWAPKPLGHCFCLQEPTVCVGMREDWGLGQTDLHHLTRLLSRGATQPVLWSEARSQLPPVCDSKKRACAYIFTGGRSISMSLSHHAAPFPQSSTSPMVGLIGMRVILGKTPVLPPNRKTLLCLPLILIPGAAGNNEVCAQLSVRPMMHGAGSRSLARSSTHGCIGPAALSWEIIKKNFLLFSSLFVISKRSRSAASVTQRATRCGLTRCLNIYFSEL